MTRESADDCIRRSLETFRDSTSADAAFAIFLDNSGKHIESVLCARGHFAQCHPEALRGVAIDSLPWLSSRSDHLRLSEFRDTASPRPEQTEDAGTLAELAIGSALLVAYRIQDQLAGYFGVAYGLPRGGFDVNLQLMMKLLGTSLSTGLERVRLTVALNRIEERNALAELAANDGLWDFDVEGNDVYFSPRWRTMLGYDESDLKGGFDWRSLVHPDDVSRVQAAIREHVAAKTPIFESIHRMHHRNGEWRWVISRAKAQLDAHGRLLRLVGVELDITERKLYEEALFREKESAQITLQSIGDGVITTDAASTIDYINPVAEQLTGWRLEDAMGPRWKKYSALP
jgi:PAS domain S-box-containing protein